MRIFTKMVTDVMIIFSCPLDLSYVYVFESVFSKGPYVIYTIIYCLCKRRAENTTSSNHHAFSLFDKSGCKVCISIHHINTHHMIVANTESVSQTSS